MNYGVCGTSVVCLCECIWCPLWSEVWCVCLENPVIGQVVCVFGSSYSECVCVGVGDSV